jgi:acid stress chaperone HdeA
LCDIISFISKKGETSMKKLSRVLVAGVAIAFVLPWSGSALAKEKIKDITCEQYLGMDPDTQENVVYWLDGVNAASSVGHVAAEDIEIGYDGWGEPVAAIITACEGDKSASLWSKIKANAYKVDKEIKAEAHKLDKEIKDEVHKLEKKI